MAAQMQDQTIALPVTCYACATPVARQSNVTHVAVGYSGEVTVSCTRCGFDAVFSVNNAQPDTEIVYTFSPEHKAVRMAQRRVLADAEEEHEGRVKSMRASSTAEAKAPDAHSVEDV
jgi:hypothetical protein